MRARGAAVLLAVALLRPGPAAAGPGDWIRWRVDPPDPACTAIRTVELSETRAAEEEAGVAQRWIRIDVGDGERRRFRIALLVADDAADPLARASVKRYRLTPDAGPALEYVDARTGRAALPGFEPWDLLVPRGPDPSDLYPREARFAGRRLVEVARGRGRSAADGDAARGLRILRLDAEVVVGTSRWFRDDGSGRRPGGDWTWRDLDAADYAAMVDAGFNLFIVPPAHLDRVLDRPVFFACAAGPAAPPDLPWRSNYLGAYPFMDEPAVRAMRDGALDGVSGPGEVAERLARYAADMLEGDGPYARGFLAAELAKTGCAMDGLRPTWLPAWEAAASAAQYELEAGASGVCWESRLRPAEFARHLRRYTGVPFPVDARAGLDLHFALLRGAARRAGAPWGVSVYGQMDDEAADLLFPAAYEAGASWFWAWTSDGAHHVPFARQLALARALRAHAQANPRPEGAAVRSRLANEVVVVPRGHPMDEVALGLHGNGRPWESRSLDPGTRGAEGVPIRDVVASALRATLGALERREPFDIVFVDADEPVDDYERVVRITAGAGTGTGK